MRRIRWRKPGKWAGTAVVALLVVAWAASWRRGFGLSQGFPGGYNAAALVKGSIEAHFVREPSYRPTDPAVSWRSFDISRYPDAVWMPRYESRAIGSGSDAALDLPLWTLLLPVIIAKGLLWHFDRRRPPGICVKCAYDLSGNRTGLCPECGAKVQA